MGWITVALVAVALFGCLLASVLLNATVQRQLIFMHRLRWPPVNFQKPGKPCTIKSMPRISQLFGLFQGLANTEAHWIEGHAGPIGLWLTKPNARCAGEHHSGTFVLYCHGNGENRAWAPAVDKVRQLVAEPICATVVSFDYRGFGDSPGTPTEAGIVSDALAVWRWIEARQAPYERAVLYGHSLGSSVALQVALRLTARSALPEPARPPDALVLDAAFSSMEDIVTGWLPAATHRLIHEKLATPHRFVSSNAAKGLPGDLPLLMLHGTDDSVVPVTLGRKLRDAVVRSARISWVEIPGAGHEDAGTTPTAREALRRFLASGSEPVGATSGEGDFGGGGTGSAACVSTHSAPACDDQGLNGEQGGGWGGRAPLPSLPDELTFLSADDQQLMQQLDAEIARREPQVHDGSGSGSSPGELL